MSEFVKKYIRKSISGSILARPIEPPSNPKVEEVTATSPQRSKMMEIRKMNVLEK